jgi:hypothetical protein
MMKPASLSGEVLVVEREGARMIPQSRERFGGLLPMKTRVVQSRDCGTAAARMAAPHETGLNSQGRMTMRESREKTRECTKRVRI